MTVPDITIVIPTANRSDLCRDALGSIRRFESVTNLAIETIVVEQSESPTYDIPEWFDGVWLHTQRRSVCHARNIGADRAQSETVLFLDDDAEIAVGAEAVFRQHRSTDNVVTVGLIDFGEPSTLDRVTRPPAELGPTNLFRYFLESGALWDVEALRASGGFDERIGLPLEFGAEEGAQLVGRLVTATGRPVGYVPIKIGSHPAVAEPPPSKALAYGRGAGSLLWMNPSWWTIRYVIVVSGRRLGGLLLAIARRDHTKRRVISHWLRGLANGVIVARTHRHATRRHPQIVTHRPSP
jgi:glycosyltransferase involved in cell wall biosynthesis